MERSGDSHSPEYCCAAVEQSLGIRVERRKVSISKEIRLVLLVVSVKLSEGRMTQMKRRASDRGFSGPLPSRIRHARRMAGFTQAALAKGVGTGSSAVAQWELPAGTSPTVEHLVKIAVSCGVAFEWLATGRGPISLAQSETPAVDLSSFAADHVEDRLLIAFRRIPARKREMFVRWLEEFF